MRDLEAELDLEQRRARDAAAENKKLQKQLADLRTQADDDHRMVAELSDEVSTLQMKIVTLKRQLDENVPLLPSLTSIYLATATHLESEQTVYTFFFRFSFLSIYFLCWKQVWLQPPNLLSKKTKIVGAKFLLSVPQPKLLEHPLHVCLYLLRCNLCTFYASG